MQQLTSGQLEQELISEGISEKNSHILANLAQSVVEAKNPSSLRVKFDCGLNDNGKTIVKSRTYSNLKHDAAALDVYNVADALASLQQHDVLEISKIDNTTLA